MNVYQLDHYRFHRQQPARLRQLDWADEPRLFRGLRYSIPIAAALWGVMIGIAVGLWGWLA